MKKVYLFDWGDTLMVDTPGQKGKMCEWPKIEVVPYARELLQHLSTQSDIYIATNAVDSSERDIVRAFDRAGLAEFIAGYFCRTNLGIPKDSKEFYLTIANKLSLEPSQLVMIGDNLERDVLLPLDAGLNAIWFNKNNESSESPLRFAEISCLSELYS